MSDVAYIARSKDAVLRVYYDECPENPREWDNLGKIVCWHPRYTLGDEHKYSEPKDFLASITSDLLSEDAQQELISKHFPDYAANDPYYELEDLPFDVLLQAIKNHAVVLPVYMLEHSVIRLSTGDFNDPWDSGQVGWIYVTHDTVKAEYGDLSPESLAKATKYLQGEVETQSDYVDGQCYGYELRTRDGEEDSCWGFYGSDFANNGMKEQIEAKYAFLVDALEPCFSGDEDDDFEEEEA